MIDTSHCPICRKPCNGQTEGCGGYVVFRCPCQNGLAIYSKGAIAPYEMKRFEKPKRRKNK